MCDALAAGDGAAAYATIDRVAEAGHDPRRFASDLLERFRDLIVLQQVPDAVTKGLIDGPADQLDAMSAQATRLGPATLSRCADIVHNGLVEMRGTTAPRLLLELITARMLLPGADDSTGALLQRLERMERRLTLTADHRRRRYAISPRTAPTTEPSPPRPSRPQRGTARRPSRPLAAAGGVRQRRAARPAPRRPQPVGGRRRVRFRGTSAPHEAVPTPGRGASADAVCLDRCRLGRRADSAMPAIRLGGGRFRDAGRPPQRRAMRPGGRWRFAGRSGSVADRASAAVDPGSVPPR